MRKKGSKFLKIGKVATDMIHTMPVCAKSVEEREAEFLSAGEQKDTKSVTASKSNDVACQLALLAVLRH